MDRVFSEAWHTFVIWLTFKHYEDLPRQNHHFLLLC